MPVLSGVTVVVTRPTHQADNLCQLIEAEGGEALRFPVIEIAPPENLEHFRRQLAHLADYDLAIFISANAVSATQELLKAETTWPDSLPTAAVGKATAKMIAAAGLPTPLVAPPPHNSEALLDLPQLKNVNGKRVLIFRGGEGRELLRDSLVKRGATVEYVECYRRVVPKTDFSELIAVLHQQQKPAIVVTSNEGLRNLMAMLDIQQQAVLRDCQLIVISERTAALSAALGFRQQAKLAVAANDDAILESLKTWASSLNTP